MPSLVLDSVQSIYGTESAFICGPFDIMRILVVGGGGREHALAWKLARSPRATRVYVAPGNAGTAREPKCENVAISADDVDALLRFAQKTHVDLTVVGPEAPLVAGIVDRFIAVGLRCFGPTKACARLEGSKRYAKEFLRGHGIPTAQFEESSSYAQTESLVLRTTDFSTTEFIAEGPEPHALRFPCVLKADGLAAGKGVVIVNTRDELLATARRIQQDRALGPAGEILVIENFLEGEEVSFIVMVDGHSALPLATSQDHKRAFDNDEGPNTGGMGAYSPAPIVTSALSDRIMREVIEPTVRGLAQQDTPYTGFLYAGLMVTPDGTPNVLEFNCRFGDPETQPILMRLQTDLVDLIEIALDGRLDRAAARWNARPALGVVMAAGGYPGSYRKGDVIEGLPRADAPDVKVFHAGTAERDGQVITNGGRVLCVTALGATVCAARARAYEVVESIHWQDAHYRRDIGYRAVAREKA
jgi:phosphoribosylamine--glycine ligase